MPSSDQVTVVDKVVLESYLKKLYLTTFIRQHEAYAAEAAQNNQSYSRFLLALAEQEVQEREVRRRQRRLKEAKIPVVKDLTSFDFSVIPQLNQQKIRQLLTGEYIEKLEPVILIGNPGLGKPISPPHWLWPPRSRCCGFASIMRLHWSMNYSRRRTTAASRHSFAKPATSI